MSLDGLSLSDSTYALLVWIGKRYHAGLVEGHTTFLFHDAGRDDGQGILEHCDGDAVRRTNQADLVALNQLGLLRYLYNSAVSHYRPYGRFTVNEIGLRYLTRTHSRAEENDAEH